MSGVCIGECWHEALAAGETGSFVRVYIDGHSSRVRLLQRALGRASAWAFAQRVLDALPNLGLNAAPRLTPAQEAVLGLVAEGLSNHEIAEQLSVALTTVKSHLQNIYKRPGVRSRTRAVAVSRRSFDRRQAPSLDKHGAQYGRYVALEFSLEPGGTP